MKKLIYSILFIVMIGCSNNKVVFWCGDHPCKNKNERESYFKKTMIVEIKELKKIKAKENSEIEKILQQDATKEEKKIKKKKNLPRQAKLEEKRGIKEEKNLARQVKLEEKRRIKEEKNLTKPIWKNEKKIIKKEKKTSTQNVNINTTFTNTLIDSTKFNQLVEKITKKNTLRPYPDINDTPN